MIFPTGPIRNPSKSSHGFTLSYYNTKKNNHKSKKICANAEAGIDKDVIRDVAGSRACRGMRLQRWKKRKAK